MQTEHLKSARTLAKAGTSFFPPAGTLAVCLLILCVSVAQPL